MTTAPNLRFKEALETLNHEHQEAIATGLRAQEAAMLSLSSRGLTFSIFGYSMLVIDEGMWRNGT